MKCLHFVFGFSFSFSFSLLFGSSVKTRMQYKIIMKYEDAHTKTKVLTDRDIPKKTAKLSSQLSPEKFFVCLISLNFVK